MDRDAFLAANEAYHAAVIDLAENEYLSQGFRQLRLRELYAVALKDTPATPEGVVTLHERLTDSIAASDATGALKAILSWGEAARASVHDVLGGDAESLPAGDDLRPAGVVEDLSLAKAKEQSSREGDVDALVMALDARAALEIGITQSLGGSLTTAADRDALVARLRAFTPLVRGVGAARVSRYIRADDAFHRIFFSLLRNPSLFEIYNAMDLPELMRRVLEDAPSSIREVFDDHRGAHRRPAHRQRACGGRRDHPTRQPGPGGARGVARAAGRAQPARRETAPPSAVPTRFELNA